MCKVNNDHRHDQKIKLTWVFDADELIPGRKNTFTNLGCFLWCQENYAIQGILDQPGTKRGFKIVQNKVHTLFSWRYFEYMENEDVDKNILKNHYPEAHIYTISSFFLLDFEKLMF